MKIIILGVEYIYQINLISSRLSTSYLLFLTVDTEKMNKVNLFPIHAMKAYKWSTAVAPFILNLSSRLRCSASHPTHFTSGKGAPSTHSSADWGLGRPQSQSDYFGERKIFCPWEELNPQIVPAQLKGFFWWGGGGGQACVAVKCSLLLRRLFDNKVVSKILDNERHKNCNLWHYIPKELRNFHNKVVLSEL